MTEKHESLQHHITPRLDEARLARQREAISARLARRDWRRWPLLLVPCVLALALVVFRGRSEPPSGLQGTIVEAPSGASLPMTLLDGSRVVLAPGSRLSLMTLLPKDIRMDLSHGELDLDVTHVDGRSFVVVSAGYEVRVLGTHFAVRHPDGVETPTLEVRVFRGRVRVTRLGDPTAVRVLGAGETWATVLDHAERAAAPPASHFVPSSISDAASTDVAVDAPPDAASPETAPAPLAIKPSAKELWAQAEAARGAKHFQDEAQALNMLRLRHRTDPRAGLAAFELGRLRQDTLHDPAGAAEAFADAVVLAPNGPFREDAEARRIEALDASGNRVKCIEAKSAFLIRYSGGVHRQQVSRMCDPR